MSGRAAPPAAPRSCADSRVDMAEMVLPNDTNTHGNALGGRVMHWIDMCAAVASMRYAGRPMVTASVDELHFLGPLRIGEMEIGRASCRERV